MQGFNLEITKQKCILKSVLTCYF